MASPSPWPLSLSAGGPPAEVASPENIASESPPPAAGDRHLATPFPALIDNIVAATSDVERQAEADNLRLAAEQYWRANTRAAHTAVSQDLDRRIWSLIHSPDQARRLAGIAVLTALVRPTNEAYQDRIMRADFALRALDSEAIVAYCDEETSDAATSLMQKIATDNSKPVRRSVENALDYAFYDIVHHGANFSNATDAYARARTVRNCMLVSKLAPLFPACVSRLGTEVTVKQIIARLGENDPVVRRYVVRCLVSILSFAARPKSNGKSLAILPAVVKVVRKYIRRVLRPPEKDPTALTLANVPVVVGALSVLSAMLECEPVRNIVVLAEHDGLYNLFTRLVLALRLSTANPVRGVVASTLPHLVAAAPARFCESNHLVCAVQFLTERATDHTLARGDRGEATVALANIVRTIGVAAVDPLLENLIKLCVKLLLEVVISKISVEDLLKAARDGYSLPDSRLVSTAFSRRTPQRNSAAALAARPARGGPSAPHITLEMITPPSDPPAGIAQGSILQLITSVAVMTSANNPCLREHAKVLISRMFMLDVCDELVHALDAVVAVVPERADYAQNVLIRRLDAVLIAAPENMKSAPEFCSVNGLFHQRSSSNASVGPVSALAHVSSLATGGAARTGGQADVKYKLELLKDPLKRPDTTSQPSPTKATPQDALSILAKFQFKNVPALRLAFFANSHVVNFLESTSIVNRRLAVRACLNLMRCAIDNDGGPKGKLRDNTFMIVQQIVSVAVVDPSRRVRLTALEGLDGTHFERYLVQKDLLSRIAICLQDEDLGIRALALQLVWRLRRLDAAEADPLLRRFVYHVLTVLRMPGAAVSEMRTQTTSLLAELIVGGGDFVKLYARPFAEVLLQCLHWNLENITEVDTNAVLPVLNAIGNLAGVLSTDAFEDPYARPLVHALVITVLDVDVSSIEFRLASLGALTKVIKSTALAVKPHSIDPRLLGQMVANLKTEGDESVRIAILALLGSIGAINPEREDAKYVALPSVHTAKSVGKNSAAGYYKLHNGVVGFGGGPVAGTLHGGSVGPVSVDAVDPRDLNLPDSSSRPLQINLHGEFVPGTTVAVHFNGSSPSRSDKIVELQLDAPPLVPNAARGDDFLWINSVIERKVAVWNQSELHNYSLVNKLDHPFTDSEYYFPSAALDVLLGIVGLDSSAPQHLDAVDAIIRLVVVVKTSPKCLYFLKEIVPRILWMMQPRRIDGRIIVTHFLEKLFDYLSDLVKIVKEDFVEFLPDTISLCHSYLTSDTGQGHQPAVAPVTELLQVLRKEVDFVFRPYAVYLLGPMISALMRDTSADRHATSAIVATFGCFGGLLSHYGEIVCPVLVYVFEDKTAPSPVRQAALDTLASLMRPYSPLGDIVSLIMHPLMRALATIGQGPDADGKSLARSAATALREVSFGAPAEFVVFVPIVAKALLASGLGQDGQQRWSSERSHQCKGLEAVLLHSDADVAERILRYRSPVESSPEMAEDGTEHGAQWLRNLALELENTYVSGGGMGPAVRRGENGTFDAAGGVGNGAAIGAAGDEAAAAGGALPQNAALEPDAGLLLEKFAIEESFQTADWTEWFDSLGVALLGQSGKAAMRAVAQLAERNPMVGRRLFNAAFLSCWPKLGQAGPDGEVHEQILKIFEDALRSQTIPLVVKQALLDLFEFMDHDERPLPIDPEILAQAAVHVGAYAKALRSRETVYMQCQHPGEYQAVLSDKFGLIEVYNNLNHSVSAVGTLRHYEARVGRSQAVQVKQQYNETLMMLPEALEVYREAKSWCHGSPSVCEVNADSEQRGMRLFKDEFHLKKGAEISPSLASYEPMINPDRTLANPLSRSDLKAAGVNAQDYVDLNWFLTVSEMRVLDRLGEWRTMEDDVSNAWEEADGNSVARVGLATAARGCSVAFDLSRWGVFRERVGNLSEDGEGWEFHYYKSLLCVQESRTDSAKIEEASRHVEEARKFLILGLTTRAAEGYPRAYWDFLNAQHLVELDEMIDCIRGGNLPEAQRRLQKVWDARSDGARSDQHTWYQLLMIRSLLSRPIQSKGHWLSFVTKCRKDNRLPMATEALRKLIKDLLLAEVKANAEDDLSTKLAERPDLACVMPLVGEEKGADLSVKGWSRESLKAIPDTAIQFACVKHMWAVGEKRKAFLALQDCVSAHSVLSEKEPGEIRLLSEFDASGEHNGELYGEIFLKLAKWSDRVLSMPDGHLYTTRQDALHYALCATEWNPGWYKAWHTWAQFNVDLAENEVDKLEELQRNRGNSPNPASRHPRVRRRRRAARRTSRSRIIDFDAKLPNLPEGVVAQLKCAVDGFFRAIKHSGKTTLEDVLTVLKLWFKYGGSDAVGMTSFFNECFERSSPECWLNVVPQIIARLHSTDAKVRDGIESLLIRIGIAHPHAVVYPLTVAAETPGDSKTQHVRRLSAENVLKRMKEEHRDIVDQARLVAFELNRVAILEHEKWYDRIEEASRLYYAEHNAAGMLESLRPLHEQMYTKDAETECERQFRRDFGPDLRQADLLGHELLVSSRSHPDVSDNPAEKRRREEIMERAWGLYLQVFRRLQRVQESMNLLDMQNVSPQLQDVENLVLAIPGSYKHDRADNGRQGAFSDGIQPTIRYFASRMEVVQSKQRPRKIQIVDCNGKSHAFLLKGHDDLRQDERVMQVFGLMNAHLAQSEDRTVRYGAQLMRYGVVALSSNAGLIELVSNTDTMHTLVKTFRETRKVMPNIEYKVMGRVAPEHEKLPLLQKVDLFEFMLANTGGRDISRVLWLRSRNSEMWLDRRTNFARTLATTSIAGYMVGLGDRHPSNIMIERDSGKIMHIDFGDCFEVAMHREKFPEKIPFRLTRMLVHALEPCGVEGHFRHMAVGMMKVLRQENTTEAILSMMEAFVYDPLIRQKLVDGAELTELDAEENGVQEPSLGIVPSGPFAESYAEAQCLAGVIHRAGEVGATGDGIEQIGPTPSQQSRSQRDFFLGRHGRSMSTKYRDLVNSRASEAIYRVEDKLHGTDFDDVIGELTEEQQFARLVEEAQNVEYLCQLFSGYVAQW